MNARPIAILALLAALGACNTPTRQIQDITAADQTPLDRECRQEATRQAAVNRDLGRQANIDNSMIVVRMNQERQDLQDNAFRDCLRRRGAPLPGGVERVRLPQLFVF
jgi:hypothetical protein